MVRLLAWVLAAAAAVYLVFVGGAWWGIYRSDLRVLTLTIAGIGLAVWAVAAWRDQRWRPRTVLMPAILAALGSLTLSTVFSRIPRISLEYLAYAIVLAALYLLLVRLFASDFFRPRMTTLGATLFLVIVGSFLFRVTANWVEWWGLLGRLALPPLRPGFEGLTYLNPSAVLTMSALLAVPAAASAGSSRRWGGLAVSLIALAVVGVAVLSGSRAGWLALALTAVIIPPLWLSVADHRTRVRAATRSISASRAARIILVVLSVALVSLAVALGPALLLRVGAGGEGLRYDLVVNAIRVFSQSPLVGTGPGTWVIQRVRYTQPDELDYYIPHAHNLEAQTLAELGVVGAIAGLIVVGSLVWLFRGAATGADPARRRWAWAGVAALVYFGLHQVLDFYVNMPAFLFAAALPVAYLDATTPEPVRTGRSHGAPTAFARRAVRLAGACGVLLAMSGLLVQEIPAGELERAVSAADAGDWQGAAGLAADAARTDPEVTPYLFTAGLSASRAGSHLIAADYFERVAAQDDLPEAWLNLAAERSELAQPEQALDALRNAFVLGQQRPAVSMPIGDLALRLGDTDLARHAFTAALLARPSLAADGWWMAATDRHRVFDDSLRVALAQAVPRTAWELELMIGDYDSASALATTSGVAVAPLVTRAWAGDTAAATELKTDCLAKPLETDTLLWCARIEGRRGDIQQANAFRELASIASSGAFEIGAELRVATSGTGSPMFGSPADFWGTYTYRRPTPNNILVPSLIHLKLE